MNLNAANSIRTTEALGMLQWLKVRVLGGQQFGALLSALHTAVFLGFSYMAMTLVTGWAQQMMTAMGFAERQ